MADITLSSELQKIHDRIAPKKEKHKEEKPNERYKYSEADKNKAARFLIEEKYPLTHIAKALCTFPVTVNGWAGVKPTKKKKKQSGSVRYELRQCVIKIQILLKSCSTQKELDAVEKFIKENIVSKLQQLVKDRDAEIKQEETQRKEKEAAEARAAKVKKLKEAEKLVAKLKSELS